MQANDGDVAGGGARLWIVLAAVLGLAAGTGAALWRRAEGRVADLGDALQTEALLRAGVERERARVAADLVRAEAALATAKGAVAQAEAVARSAAEGAAADLRPRLRQAEERGQRLETELVEARRAHAVADAATEAWKTQAATVEADLRRDLAARDATIATLEQAAERAQQTNAQLTRDLAASKTALEGANAARRREAESASAALRDALASGRTAEGRASALASEVSAARASLQHATTNARITLRNDGDRAYVNQVGVAYFDGSGSLQIRVVAEDTIVGAGEELDLGQGVFAVAMMHEPGLLGGTTDAWRLDYHGYSGGGSVVFSVKPDW